MWARVIGIALGIWLMVAPAVLDYGGRADTIDRIVGPLVVASAIIALAPAGRELRWIHLLLGFALVVPWWFANRHLDAILANVVAGLLIMALAPVGSACGRIGGGWASVLRPHPQSAFRNDKEAPS